MRSVGACVLILFVAACADRTERWQPPRQGPAAPIQPPTPPRRLAPPANAPQPDLTTAPAVLAFLAASSEAPSGDDCRGLLEGLSRPTLGAAVERLAHDAQSWTARCERGATEGTWSCEAVFEDHRGDQTEFSAKLRFDVRSPPGELVPSSLRCELAG